MNKEPLDAKVRYLREVEKLSIRQIARQLGICRKRVRGVVRTEVPVTVVRPRKALILDPYRHLIATWYKDYPHLKAKQIYERLVPYGYCGSYRRLAELTQSYRRSKPEVYYPLVFLPGEEAQVDWFFFKHPALGMVAGFLYVLAYSRYAWGKFYPRTTFEFFLDGHLQCFEHLKGVARRHRYDNLKSVVLGRKEKRVEYNPQFLDFSRFFGFSIHACNPYSGNEKGRVERPIRDARVFLYGLDFMDLDDLNTKFQRWLTKRNQQVHRTTGKTPLVLLAEEKLLRMPSGAYPPTRSIPAVGISKTALVEFETNHYSVPSSCAGQKAQLIAWPERIEIYVSSDKVAVHPRSFGRKQFIQNPLHAQKLLERTGRFKYQRILQVIQAMDPDFRDFLDGHKDESEKTQAAYELFKLLKIYSSAILTSAIRELAGMGTFKIKALHSLLNLPSPKEDNPLWPADPKLLNMTYQHRSLKDYDPTE